MGTLRIAIVALGFVLIGAAGALAGADTEPVIAVPGRPGVPIIINGQDVSGAVIEGEWGLARGHAGITIIRPIYRWRRNWGLGCGRGPDRRWRAIIREPDARGGSAGSKSCRRPTGLCRRRRKLISASGGWSR